MEYLVTWKIDMEDCDSPREAAWRALIVQRDNDTANSATVFDVTDKATGETVTISLEIRRRKEST